MPLPDTIGEHKKSTPANLKFSVVIISTTRYNELVKEKPSTDKTLEIIEPLLKEKGYDLANKEIVADDEGLIKACVKAFASSKDLDVMVTCGGTGISPKDMTVDVLAAMKAKVLPGFGELFRFLSYQDVGTSAMLSRAEAFVINQKPIFCLPGSPKAVKLAVEKIILPEIAHFLAMLRKVE
nr:molybdenum cofactor biosynthesis protein B [Candidatus Sigynarchaeota archaeon]